MNLFDTPKMTLYRFFKVEIAIHGLKLRAHLFLKFYFGDYSTLSLQCQKRPVVHMHSKSRIKINSGF
jgi:hypothetical protein